MTATRIELHGKINVWFITTPDALEEATKRFETMADQARQEFPDHAIELNAEIRQVKT